MNLFNFHDDLMRQVLFLPSLHRSISKRLKDMIDITQPVAGLEVTLSLSYSRPWAQNQFDGVMDLPSRGLQSGWVWGLLKDPRRVRHS